MAWCIPLPDPLPKPPIKTLESRRIRIPLDDPLPRPPLKALKSWHGVSDGGERTLSMARCSSHDDPLPRTPLKTLNSWHGVSKSDERTLIWRGVSHRMIHSPATNRRHSPRAHAKNVIPACRSLQCQRTVSLEH